MPPLFQAALASGLVDVVLIPKVPYKLGSMVAYVERLLGVQGHVVICMAEGAGQVGGAGRASG